MTIVTTLLLLAVMGVPVNAKDTGTTDVELSVTYGQSEARDMLSLINEFRTGNETWYWNESDTEKVQVSGLQPLKYSYELEKIAMQRAAEISLSFSHTRPNGQSTFSLGNFYGENIAAGYGSASAVMEGWKETNYGYSGQGHRRNMLNSSFTHVGIGHVYANGFHYWVQDFGIGSSVGTATSANNTTTVVIISVADGSVVSFTLDNDSISLAVNESKSVSSQTGTLLMTDSWPHGAPVTVKPAWTVGNSSIAALQNGKLTGRTPGNTTIKASLFGRSVSVGVTVTCSGHSWGSWQTTKEATCTQAGSRTRKCTLCGTEQTETVKTLGHDYKKTVTAATCKEKGYTTYKCSRCGDSYKADYTSVKAHTWGAWKTVKEATCTKNGSRSHSCSVCNTTETETVKAQGHDYKKTVTPATCKEKGYTTYKCSRCGDSYEGDYTSVKAHTWGAWKTMKEATCTMTGERSRSCTVCGAAETEITDKNAHDYKNGKCTVCGATVPNSGDPAETNPAVTEPTVTEPVATDPAETEPIVTEPTATEPLETEPTGTELTETEPTETDQTETEPTETEAVESDLTEAGSDDTDPAVTEPTEAEQTEEEPSVTTGESFTGSSDKNNDADNGGLSRIAPATIGIIIAAGAAVIIIIFVRRRRKNRK